MEKSLSLGQKQRLSKKVEPFTMKNEILYRMGHDNTLRRCLSTIEASKVMKELHEGIVRGHFAIEITNKKMLNARYWWPTMYKNVSDFYRSCDACQCTKGLAMQSLAKLIKTLQNNLS
jgi:hypothetical protein